MIKKILDKESTKSSRILNDASAISEVKLLLSNNEMEDLHMLQNAFPNSTNANVIIENGEREQIKKLNKIHNGDIYTSDEIKELCKKYRLRFLPASLYKGNIPVSLLHELKHKFVDENKMAHLANGSSTIYERNLFIIAPSGMFKINSYYNQKKESIKEARRLRKLDPACFIKIEDDKFLFIKEWGNSFSGFRRILGVTTAKHKTLNALFFLSWCLYIAIGVSILKFIASFMVVIKDRIETPLILVGLIITFFWFAVTAISWVLPPENGFFMSLIKENGLWKVDKKYCTENNWNSN